MIKGSCLCQTVHYTINGEVGDIVHCHCQTCRKAHGSAFSSVAAVALSDFSLEGREALNHYESSPGKFRYFCRHCGSQIYAQRTHQSHIILRLGTLDDSPDAIERSHIWVSEKACWYDLNATLPQYSTTEPS